jgi:DNA primase
MSSNGRFVDFKEVKERVTIEELLDHYGLLETLRRQGDTLAGPCPIHRGRSRTAFKADTRRNIWNCFGPCRGGNILDFVAQKEELSIRDAALLIADRFALKSSEKPRERHAHEALKENASGQRGESAPAAASAKPAGENKPLPFAGLKNLNPEHGHLRRFGLKPETLKHFGAGYCGAGIMKGTLAVPIHNAEGELVAYAGREMSGEGYRYPPNFNRSLEIFNLHRAVLSTRPVQEGLILTPDILDVLRLHEAGLDNVAALTGYEVSREQIELLRGSVRAQERITLIVRGELSSQELVMALYRGFHVRLIETDKDVADKRTLLRVRR